MEELSETEVDWLTTKILKNPLFVSFIGIGCISLSAGLYAIENFKAYGYQVTHND